MERSADKRRRMSRQVVGPNGAFAQHQIIDKQNAVGAVEADCYAPANFGADGGRIQDSPGEEGRAVTAKSTTIAAISVVVGHIKRTEEGKFVLDENLFEANNLARQSIAHIDAALCGSTDESIIAELANYLPITTCEAVQIVMARCPESWH